MKKLATTLALTLGLLFGGAALAVPPSAATPSCVDSDGDGELDREWVDVDGNGELDPPEWVDNDGDGVLDNPCIIPGSTAGGTGEEIATPVQVATPEPATKATRADERRAEKKAKKARARAKRRGLR